MTNKEFDEAVESGENRLRKLHGLKPKNKIQKKNREFLSKLIDRENFYANKQKERAGWAFLVLTLIVAGYFFVWAWTNF